MLLAYTLTLWLAPLLLNICSISISPEQAGCVSVSVSVLVSVFDVPDQLLGCQQVQVLGLLSPVRALAPGQFELLRLSVGRGSGEGGRSGCCVFRGRSHGTGVTWSQHKNVMKFHKNKSTHPQSPPNHIPCRGRPGHAMPSASRSQWQRQQRRRRRRRSAFGLHVGVDVDVNVECCGWVAEGEWRRFYDHGPGRLLDMAKCALAA